MSNLAQTTVLGLLVYELTGSELDLGFLGLAEFAPAALLVVVAGHVVDRFDRRRVAALGALSNAVVALGMAWYVRDPHGLSTTPIFLLVIAFGAGQAFLAPALRSIPPAMVPNAGVPWLVARRSIASEVATILGPILGGLLYVAGVWVALVAVAALSMIGAAWQSLPSGSPTKNGFARASSALSATTRLATFSRRASPPREAASTRHWRVYGSSALRRSFSAPSRSTSLPCSSVAR